MVSELASRYSTQDAYKVCAEQALKEAPSSCDQINLTASATLLPGQLLANHADAFCHRRMPSNVHHVLAHRGCHAAARQQAQRVQCLCRVPVRPILQRLADCRTCRLRSCNNHSASLAQRADRADNVIRESILVKLLPSSLQSLTNKQRNDLNAGEHLAETDASKIRIHSIACILLRN